jgi:uncharacterized membrane protein
LIQVFFGLLASLFWGGSDFLGGVISRKIGPARSTFYVESFGFVLLLIVGLLWGEPRIGWMDWVWCMLAGVIGALGLLVFNRSLAEGKMAIVAPVSSLIGAALPVIGGVLLSGLPPATTLAGFILALVAIWLITQVGNSHDKLRSLKELRLPIIAGIGFGFYFIFIHLGSQDAIIWPMVVSRAFGAITVLIYATFTRQIKPAPHSPWFWIILNMLGDVGGNVFYILAGQIGRMDVTVVLSSLYSGVTVIMGWLILKEKINRSQFIGILLALGAIILLSI